MTDADQELVVTELLRRLRGDLAVCGIAGVLERSGAPGRDASSCSGWAT